MFGFNNDLENRVEKLEDMLQYPNLNEGELFRLVEYIKDEIRLDEIRKRSFVDQSKLQSEIMESISNSKLQSEIMESIFNDLNPEKKTRKRRTRKAKSRK